MGFLRDFLFLFFGFVFNFEDRLVDRLFDRVDGFGIDGVVWGIVYVEGVDGFVIFGCYFCLDDSKVVFFEDFCDIG